MPSNVFMTGFPGFIAKRLVDGLLRKDPDASFTFLVQEHLRGVAKASLGDLAKTHGGLAGRCRVVAGDLTLPRLGLDRRAWSREAARATHVWHLAAVYDLAVPAAVAYRVNVAGTANLLDLCEACDGLVRLDYVSTCYVAGGRTGRIAEGELDEGQGFKNHYESTKCWAELEVRRRWERIPTAIHRPAIVVGDSRTGETDKYDGPYFMIRALLKAPSWMPMFGLGRGAARMNLVPVDFLVGAMAEAWTRPEALGRAFQWADPSPYAASELLEAIAENVGLGRPLVDIPPALAELALSQGHLRRFLRIPRELVVYANHPADFDTTNHRELLAGTDVACPDLLSYLPTLIQYVRDNPSKPFLDGRQG